MPPSMPPPVESGVLLYAHLENPEENEAKEAARLIEDHYVTLGARAAVFLDKDDTVVDSERCSQPTVAGLEEVIQQARDKGVIVSFDSDSSLFDLTIEGARFGMTGLHIAESGGIIGLPDGTEIYLVRCGEWFNKLLHHFERRIYADRMLRHATAIFHGDPWPIIHADTHFAGSQDELVMFNSGRRTTASILTGLLDQPQGGKIIRGTPESLAFYRQMATLMMEERDRLLDKQPFPDLEGIRDDFNQKLELIIMSSEAAMKRKAMQYMSQILNLPIFHMGDGVWDDTSGIPGVTTMAVANAWFKDNPQVIVADQPMTAGVIELFQNHILPQFS